MFKMNTEIEYIIFDDGVKAILTTFPSGKMLTINNRVNFILDGKSIRMPRSRFEGIARFKSGDNFDVEKGKLIARKKAMRAMYSAWYNYEKKLINELSKFYNEFYHYTNSILTKRNNIIEDIKRLA